METKIIIEKIEAEIKQLQMAKAALLGTPAKGRRGRPRKVQPVVSTLSKKRFISAEGKARIAAAQKKRWAKVRRAAKKAALIAA